MDNIKEDIEKVCNVYKLLELIEKVDIDELDDEYLKLLQHIYIKKTGNEDMKYINSLVYNHLIMMIKQLRDKMIDDSYLNKDYLLVEFNNKMIKNQNNHKQLYSDLYNLFNGLD